MQTYKDRVLRMPASLMQRKETKIQAALNRDTDGFTHLHWIFLCSYMNLHSF